MQCSRHPVALFSYPSIYSTAECLSQKFPSVCVTGAVRAPSTAQAEAPVTRGSR